MKNQIYFKFYMNMFVNPILLPSGINTFMFYTGEEPNARYSKIILTVCKEQKIVLFLDFST